MRFQVSSAPWIGIGLLLASGSGCTGSPGKFHLQHQHENFATLDAVNTRLDMLWVIDSSGSMEDNQAKVRAGIQQFAQEYMKPTWDIRVATITTDVFLAHPSFWQGPSGQTSYLTTVRAGTANYAMPYLNGQVQSGIAPRSKHYYDTTSWVTAVSNPAFPLFDLFEPSPYSPTLVTYNSSGTERFLASGMRIVDTKPQLGPNWSKLLVGNHDGPQLSMCWDRDIYSPQFFNGQTGCYHRDNPGDSKYHVGIANCVNPGPGETGPSQCVNTFANNSVHTGLPTLSTLPPSGVPGDQAWTDQLIANFRVNLTPSTVGDGSERPFQSVLQFLADNEADSDHKFFRPDSLRVIVFVGDEDDQSQLADLNQYQAGTGTNAGQGTKKHTIAENGSAPYMCRTFWPAPANAYKWTDGDSGYCVDPAWSLPVSDVKAQLDSFFLSLDGSPSSGNPNYFVAAITNMNVSPVPSIISVRYPALVDLVGNGSVTLDINQSDYTPLLATVGQQILEAKAQVTLKRAPLSTEEMIVQIIHADGTVYQLNTSQFTVEGTVLTITDLSVVSSFVTTDILNVQYEPKTIY